MIIKANKTRKDGASDKVMTPHHIAEMLIKKLPIKPGEKILDPCKGKGAFFDNYPKQNECFFCEIDDGKNFFDFQKKVDWIISNPPYSIYDEFIKHCFELSDNVVLLIPFSKVASSLKRIKDIETYGGIKKIWFIGASKCGFPFGFPCSFIWMQKGFRNNDFELIK